MGGGKPDKSNLSSKNTNKGDQQITPIQTRNRTAEKSNNKEKIGAKTSTSSTPARATSISCGDSLELLERKLLKNISQIINDRFNEMEEYIANKFTELVSSFNAEVGKLQSVCDDLQLEVATLRNSIEQLHRQQRLSDAVVTGIPFNQKEEPLQIVNKIAEAAGVLLPMPTFAFRTRNSKTKERPIIVKFPSVNDQRLFLQKCRSTGPIKLRQISPSFSSNSNVGVYESLTVHNHRILREALLLRRQKQLHSAVTRNGLVHVRVSPESKWLRITSCDMLSQFHTEADARVIDVDADTDAMGATENDAVAATNDAGV